MDRRGSDGLGGPGFIAQYPVGKDRIYWRCQRAFGAVGVCTASFRFQSEAESKAVGMAGSDTGDNPCACLDEWKPRAYMGQIYSLPGKWIGAF